MSLPTNTPTEAILARLVAYPSVCGGPNGDVIDWIAAHLRACGARLTRVPGARADAFSLIASLGPEVDQGIVLAAHVDVVPVSGQIWGQDPFTLTRSGEKLLGRGSTDMKGFLACMLSCATRAVAGAVLLRPLHLAISHDEELGCIGVRSLLTQADALRSAMGCIVGEPTGMRVVTAHKGKIAFEIACAGQSAHSADPSKGVNAIAMAGRMLGALERLSETIRKAEPEDQRFSVPHSTVQAGMIVGGTAVNIVPEHCTIAAELRLAPGRDGSIYLRWLEAEAAMVCAAFPGGGIAIRVTNAYPGLDACDASPIATVARGLVRDTQTGVVDFGTEAGLFAETLGLDAIVCGPGAIARAHKADEYILDHELAACDRFLDGVLTELRTPKPVMEFHA